MTGRRRSRAPGAIDSLGSDAVRKSATSTPCGARTVEGFSCRFTCSIREEATNTWSARLVRCASISATARGIHVRQGRVVVDAVVDDCRFVEGVRQKARVRHGEPRDRSGKSEPFQRPVHQQLAQRDVDTSHERQAAEGDLRHAHLPHSISDSLRPPHDRPERATQLLQIATGRLRRPKARHVDIQNPRTLGEAFRDVMAARSVFGKPVVAEVDDGEMAERDR